MAVKTNEVRREGKRCLNEHETRAIEECEELLDRILKFEGEISHSIVLSPFSNERIRREIETRYRDAGWQVQFCQVLRSSSYSVAIYPPREG